MVNTAILFQQFENKMASVHGSKSIQQSSDDGSRYECSPCDYEGVKEVAKHYCSQCQDYLCDSCKAAHQKMSASRSHKVVSGSLMPKKTENKTNEGIKRGVQCPCNGKDVTLYCKDHNEVICIDCKTLKHRNCNSSTIEEACADLDTTETNATKERMETLKATVEKLQQRRNDDVEKLTVKSAESRDMVEGLKRELMKKIEDLADKSLDDLAKCDKEQRQTIEQHLHTCSTALNRLELDYKPFEEAMNAGLNPLIFVHNLQLKKTLEQVNSILQDLGKEVKEPDISFDFNETLRMTDIQSLGVVRSTTLNDTRPVIADMEIKSVEKVDVKFQSDQSNPYISGSLFMSNGELILCDWCNTSVKVFKANFKQKDQIKLSSGPWGLCLMESDKIVISQPTAKSLLFMKVDPKIQTGSSITLDESCRGVAVKDGFIYVSFENGGIRVLDKTGQPLTNVYSGCRFQCPYFISIMPTGILYVSEYEGSNIRVLKDGKEIFNYSNAGISNPLGMYIDGTGNILVCEQISNNLRVIDAKGQTSKILLSGTDGLHHPCTVSVRPNDNTLIVGGHTPTLLVCKMMVS